MRLDCYLWFTRISATRSYAQQLVQKGRMRVDGRVVEKPATQVRVGNVLTFADHRGQVRVLRVEALPERRCSAPDAAICYTSLSSAC